MENREGYKQTELGWIPVDWDVIKFQDIIELMTNGFVGTASPYYTSSSDGVVYLMSRNIRQNKIDETNIIKVTKDFCENQQKSILKKNDLLTVQSGHIGTSCVIPDKYIGANIHALILTRFKNGKVNPFYTCYYLNSDFGMLKMASIFVGSTIKHINVKDFKKFNIPYPPLPEQQKIAEILTTVDDKISSIEDRIKQTEQLKKGLMEKLLTEGIGHTEFKDTEIGRIPKEWDVVKLIDYCEKICVGFVGTCERFYTNEANGVMMLRTGNLQDGNLCLKNLKYVLPEFHEKNKKSQLKPDDLLIARHGSSGQAVLVPKDFGKSNCLNIVIVRPDKTKYSPLFLKNLFNSPIIKRQMELKTAGSTQGVINTKEISNTIFPKPEIEEQNQIATILSSVDDKLEILQSKKTSYEILKKGLMEQLLTGKRRVTLSS